MSYDVKTLVKIANLYYRDHLSQLDISKKLKISKYQVTRILAKAIDYGIVKISIINPAINITNLEDKLENKFNLKRVIVVDNNGLSDSDLKSKLGLEGAKFLIDVIKDGDIIGISWGHTINEVVKNMPERVNRKITIVQMAGGFHEIDINVTCHDITKRFAEKFSTKPNLLYAPLIVRSETLLKSLIEDYSISKIYKYFDKISIALTGLGVVNDSAARFYNAGLINKEQKKKIIDSTAVGNLIEFYDKNGKINNYDFSNRIVGIPYKQLSKIPYVIGVAGGLNKLDAIKGALKGKLIDVLITDSLVAEKIISERI